MPCSTASVRRTLLPSTTKRPSKPVFVKEKATNWWPFLFQLIECPSESGGQSTRVVVCPEVHEVKPRLFTDHVRMQRRDCDLPGAQDWNDSIDFALAHHEVAGDCGSPACCRLKIDGGGNPHRRWDDLAIHP